MHDVHIYNRRSSISLFTDANHINGLETEKPMTRNTTMKETKKSDNSHNFYITIIKEA